MYVRIRSYTSRFGNPDFRESNCGLNSAETSDAIMGQRAKLVMLNNGVHIVEAVKTLGSLLTVE